MHTIYIHDAYLLVTIDQQAFCNLTINCDVIKGLIIILQSICFLSEFGESHAGYGISRIFCKNRRQLCIHERISAVCFKGFAHNPNLELARSPRRSTGIRVASGFEFSVCLFVCLFIYLFVCSGQIF